MKYMQNHLYVLIIHIIFSFGLIIYDFSLIGLISMLLSSLYLLFLKDIRKSKMINYLAQLAIFSMIPFCYTTENLVDYYLHTDWGSIITVIIMIVTLYIAQKIPNTRKESFLNVRNRYTENDAQIRKKTNVFISKTLYVSLLPLFILTLYFTWKEKLGITLIILFLVCIITRMYSSYIWRKKVIKHQQSRNEEKNYDSIKK